MSNAEPTSSLISSADQELVLLLDVIDDRLVHLVATHAEGLRDDDAAE